MICDPGGRGHYLTFKTGMLMCLFGGLKFEEDEIIWSLGF